MAHSLAARLPPHRRHDHCADVALRQPRAPLSDGTRVLGLATHPPAPSWGGMVAEAAEYIVNDPWMIVPPGLAIAFSIFALGIIGDRVRDAHADRSSTTVPSGARNCLGQV